MAFSCRGRCFCPSYHEKRALEKAGWVAEHVCAEVPHRQFVFTIPKRLRLYFRYDRSLLGTLCQAAWRTVCTVYPTDKTGDNQLGRFPEAASDDLLAGPKRNFQIFDPLDFLATCPAVAPERRRKVTQHVPEQGEVIGDSPIRSWTYETEKTRPKKILKVIFFFGLIHSK